MKVLFLILITSILTLSQTKFFADFDQEKNYHQLFDKGEWYLAKDISAYNVGSGSYVADEWMGAALVTKQFPQTELFDTLSFDYCVQANYKTSYSHLIVSFTRYNTSVFEPILYINESLTDANEMTIIPNPDTWKHVKVKLLRTTDRIKFFAPGYGAKIYIDNIRIGSNSVDDAAIINNFTESGYTLRETNPGIQIKNLGLQQKDVSVKLTINELNKTLTQNLSFNGEEAKDVFFDCSFLPVGRYQYQFEVNPSDDDSSNNIIKGEVGVYNAEWKLGKRMDPYVRPDASIGLTFNDTNYVYINSGYYENDTIFIRYNINDNSTKLLQRPPVRFADHKFIYRDNYLYIPGGIYGFEETSYSQDEVNHHEVEWVPLLLRYSLSNNKWDTLYNKLPNLENYYPVLIRDSLLYMIGTSTDNNVIQECYLYNFNANTIQQVTEIKDFSKDLIAFNDTLYLTLVNYPVLIQGIIDPNDPGKILWSDYDTIPFKYATVNKWEGNKLIFTASTYLDTNYNAFYNIGNEVILYDIKEKRFSTYLTKKTKARSAISASFMNDDKNVLFTSEYNNTPYILTEYLTGVVSVNDDKVETPASFELFQNYPNPFNAQTTISYNLNEEAFITLEIFNILGERLTTLVNQVQQRGSHKVSLDMNKYSSGVYIYILNNNGKSFSKTMMMIK